MPESNGPPQPTAAASTGSDRQANAAPPMAAVIEQTSSVVESSSDNDDMGDGEVRRRRLQNRIFNNGDGRICTQKCFPYAVVTNVGSFLLLMIITFVVNLEEPRTSLYLADLKELVDDWTTSPYVDILITEVSKGCPLDYEPMFSRTWQGTGEICLEDPELAKYFKSQ